MRSKMGKGMRQDLALGRCRRFESRMSSISDHQAAARAVLEKIDFDTGMSVERQIAMHVRQLIGTEVLKPGVRVPPIRALAQAWDTNYFTVQSALRALVREGLLVQSPRLGTYVSEGRRELQRACLYHGEDLRFRGASEFFGRLHLMTYQMLAARGVRTVSYFDHRPAAERESAPEEILSLIKDRQVDAVVSTTTHPAWLGELNLPVASLQMTAERGGIGWDVAGFARLAVEAAVHAGARSLGVVWTQSPGGRRKGGTVDEMNVQAVTEAAATAAGLEIVELPEPEWTGGYRSVEERGFLWGESIAEMAGRPAAVVVYPDTATRGIVSAFLKHGVRVPEEVMLISHRNHEMPFFTPFPVTWLTVKIEDYAATLLKQIDAQIGGGRAERTSVDVSLEAPAVRTRSRKGRTRRGE